MYTLERFNVMSMSTALGSDDHRIELLARFDVVVSIVDHHNY